MANENLATKEITQVDAAASVTAGAKVYIDNGGTFARANLDDVFKISDTFQTLRGNGSPHNGIFRGKDLTNVYTVAQMYAMIHSGNFDDLFLGDYFTVSLTTDIYTHFTGSTFDSGTTYYEASGTINERVWTATSDATPQSGKIYATKLTKTESVALMFAHFDYYYGIGDTALGTHHAVLVPRSTFATAASMNPTNTTVGAYANSDMHQITLPCYAKSLKTALENHLLAHKSWLTTAINASAASAAGGDQTGAANAAAWSAVELQLMNENQLYGSSVWSSGAYDVGADAEKLAVFNFVNPVQFGRSTTWLRSIMSAAFFCTCNNSGLAGGNGASSASYVRPIILFG